MSKLVSDQNMFLITNEYYNKNFSMFFIEKNCYNCHYILQNGIYKFNIVELKTSEIVDYFILKDLNDPNSVLSFPIKSEISDTSLYCYNDKLIYKGIAVIPNKIL